MRLTHRLARNVAVAVSFIFLLSPSRAAAQEAQPQITRVDLAIGRSYPIETEGAVTRISVANPEVADVAVIGERDVVINGRASGETDVILWGEGFPRRHYRVQVHSPSDRMQIALSVKIAEVRRDLLRNVGVSALYRNTEGTVRAGTGIFRTDNVFDEETGDIRLPGTSLFGTVLTNFDTDELLAFIDIEAQRGNARILAEPKLLAANKEQASFLAGGELPIPIVQGGQQNALANVTIQYKEFGVRLNFSPEIISDSLIKLRVNPEVSSLDYGNAVIISGFRIPALRARRMESTVDVKRSSSLIISGLFNDERERVRTGVPFLMDIPILGMLFSSTRWQQNETELVVIITPRVIDPMQPPATETVPLRPETRLPAAESLEERLQQPRSAAPRRP